jgi:sulfate permease, SulP family
MQTVFLPKLYTVLKEGYSRKQFVNDFFAGLNVAIVALPLNIAFAIASGVSPDKGLVAAIISGFVISLMGGTRIMISGPLGAFVVTVYSVLSNYGVDGLIISTFLGGLILVVMGLLKFGVAIQYIPYPLSVGLLSGIGILIFVSQIKDFFGLECGTLPADFIPKIKLLVGSFHTIDFLSSGLALLTIVLLKLWNRLGTRIPGSLVALVSVTLLAIVFSLDVETIGERFGEFPDSFPMPMIPSVEWGNIPQFFAPAFTFALLGSIIALLTATVGDSMIAARHRSNTELIAQGLGNMAVSIFGGIPVSGAIARTNTSVRNGGRTPIAGIIHAAILLVIMLFLGSYAELVPLASLAGILVVVSWNMVEWHSLYAIFKGPKHDSVVMVTTLTLTVVVSLSVAIEIGMVLAVILFMKRMADLSQIKFKGLISDDSPADAQMVELPKGVGLYEFSGPLFFGVAHRFNDLRTSYTYKDKVIILRMEQVPMIDGTGLHHLRTLINTLKNHREEVLICEIKPEVREVIDKEGIADLVELSHIHDSFEQAIEHSKVLIEQIAHKSKPASSIKK